jgi:hypothetical protein
MRLKAPEVGHVFRQCLVCGRTFRVFKHRLKRRNNGNFCSNQCLFGAWHLFSAALADGRLDWLLKEGLADLLRKDAAASQSPSWQRGKT